MTTASVQENMESFEGIQPSGAPIYIPGPLAVGSGQGRGAMGLFLENWAKCLCIQSAWANDGQAVMRARARARACVCVCVHAPTDTPGSGRGMYHHPAQGKIKLMPPLSPGLNWIPLKPLPLPPGPTFL